MIIKFDKELEVNSAVEIEYCKGKWSGPENSSVVWADKDMSVLTRSKYKVLMRDKSEGMVIRYADLHRHSDGSLLDGMTKPQEMADLTEYCGAITDHGAMYNFLEFYKAMTKSGKKPILGFEAYAEDLDGEFTQNHLVLLAKNEIGYRNLLKLTSDASNHFYYKPHVTFEMLEQHHEGVIALSGCMGGLIPSYLKNDKTDKAYEAARKYLGIFGDDFYVEFQRHHIQEEELIMGGMLKLARDLGIKVVATTDSHYPNKEDAKTHEILLCMQTKATLDSQHFSFQGDGYHIHSSEEMELLFSDHPEFLDETLNLADKVNLTLKLGEQNLPVYEIPREFKDDKDYLWHLATAGFKERFSGSEAENSSEYTERLSYEFGTICKMGFASYFLIVWDYINWARKHDIYVGPGRGSAAGSLLAYCLGITDLDPVRYGLLFERFLNPARISMPDIDVDFSSREAVDQYVLEKYGEGKVSQVITFGTLAGKMAIKDVARVLGYPVHVGANLAKMIPNRPGATIQNALDENPDFKTAYESDPTSKRIIDIAKRLEGLKRHKSVHACARLLSSIPVSDVIPTEIIRDDSTGEEVLVTQVQGPECEDLSLLKMDFLGLKNMAVIKEVSAGVVRDFGLEAVLSEVNSNKNEFYYEDIPLNDRKTYELLRDGLTGGVFQLESEGMTKVIKDMLSDIDSLPDENLEECFERLIAAVALYRPGPMDYIPDYMEGMRDKGKIRYDCEQEREILAPTYGVMVYQEQLMKIAVAMANYSLSQSDILRKACGKKKLSLMSQEHTHFIEGCSKNGISEEVAEEVWTKMVKFASYAFNRSHAACYAYLAFITAFMSAHYPVHFYAAMLNAFSTDSDKVKSYLAQAKKRGIKLLAPDVNKSEIGFTPVADEGAIRFGLQGIAGVKKAADAIVSERCNGAYKSLRDFLDRLNVNKTGIENLIFAGAFDSFGLNRHELMSSAEDIRETSKKQLKNQLSLFDEDSPFAYLKHEDEYDRNYLYEKEYEAIGTYLSGHPADDAYKQAELARIKNLTDISQVALLSDSKEVSCVGVVRDFQIRYTKNGDQMLSFRLSDAFQDIKCVVFPKDCETNKYLLGEGFIVCVLGTFNADEDFGKQIVVKTVLSQDAIRNYSESIKEITVTVTGKENQTQLLNLLNMYPGKTRVNLKRKDSDRIYRVSYSVDLSPSFIDKLSQNWIYY